MKKIIRLISGFVLTTSIVMAALLLIPLIPVADQWYQLVIVQSASMEPRLPVGSLAIYRAAATYYPGEIIAYEAGHGGDKKMIIHRVAEKKTHHQQSVYLTQGDATQYLSPQPVLAGQIKGKLIGSISNLGYVLAWFKSRAGLATVIATFFILIIIDEVTRLP